MATTSGAPRGAGTGTLGLEADVSGQLAASVPTFGNVLLSIGTGVAQSQAALDAGVIETVNKLKDTKITVVTDVIQTLDDDGLPVTAASGTQLVTSDVSVLNFFPPAVHQWDHVSISMDMTLSAVDSERGMVFTDTKWKTNAHAVGLFWGFIGWFDTDTQSTTTDATSRTREESRFASGQVRLDALLGPRPLTNFPAAIDAAIGPQLYFALGSTRETTAGDSGVVTARAVDLLITVRKANGAANPSVNIVLDAGSFLPSFKTTDGFSGSTTNAEGKIMVTLTRNIPSPLFQRPLRTSVKASLGQISNSIEINL